MADIYSDGTYALKNPDWHAEDSAWKAGKVLRMVERHALGPRLVCEIGCGAGQILKCLADSMGNGVEFHGYEISEQAFAVCRAKESEKLKFFHEDFSRSGMFPDYDLLLMIDVLEHIPDYLGYLQSIKTKARYKIFHVPLDLSVMSVLNIRSILNTYEKCGHLHYFTKETALQMFRHAGYEVVDYFYTHRSLELPAASLKTLLAKLPRSVLFRLNEDFGIRLLGGASLMVLAR